jgi:hypothetical protein
VYFVQRPLTSGLFVISAKCQLAVFQLRLCVYLRAYLPQTTLPPAVTRPSSETVTASVPRNKAYNNRFLNVPLTSMIVPLLHWEIESVLVSHTRTPRDRLRQYAQLGVHWVLRVLLDADDWKLNGHRQLWMGNIRPLVTKTHRSDEALEFDLKDRSAI